MTPCRYRAIETSSLHNVGNRSAINLKIEGYVPSKVRAPQNDQTPRRLTGSGSGRNRTRKNKNQNEYAGGGVSRLHGAMLRLAHRALSRSILLTAARQRRFKMLLSSELARDERDIQRVAKFSEVVPTHQGLPGHPFCHSSPGVRQIRDGRRKTKSESHIAVYT